MQFTAKTLFGLEKVLAEELENLGAENIKIEKRAVRFTGEHEILYKANYTLRTALSILWELKTFTATNETELYDAVKSVNWDEFITPENTFAIDKTVFSKYFSHSHYAALKTKDAIADFFSEKYKIRPSVNTNDPDLQINLRISNANCTLSIDTSEPALFKRAYRRQTDVAPINEVLAAGIILMSDYKKAKTIYDPMCGSGTILIESAYILYNIPAGYKRKSFAFQKLRDFKPEIWKKVKAEADANIKTHIDTKIIGSDINSQALNIARGNIANASLSSRIMIKTANATRSNAPEKEGIIITNPPYDIRLKKGDINKFYKDFGTNLKNNYKGWDVYIISANIEALKNIGIRYTTTVELYNAKLKTFYNKYEMFKPVYKKKRKRIVK